MRSRSIGAHVASMVAAAMAAAMGGPVLPVEVRPLPAPPRASLTAAPRRPRPAHLDADRLRDAGLKQDGKAGKRQRDALASAKRGG